MKLRSIALHHIGSHQHTTLTQLGDGLTVIFGPNEAGKSTLLAGWRALLFGQATHSEGTISLRPGARVSGELEDDAGNQWRVERALGGRRRSTPTLVCADGRRLSGQAELRHQFPALQVVEALIYQSVFTFQLGELQDLRGQKGVEDRIYAVGELGGLSPIAMEQALQQSAKELFNPNPRARNARLLQCLSELSQVQKERAALDDTPSAYVRTREAQVRVEVSRQEMERKLGEALAGSAHVAKLQELHPVHQEIRAGEEKLRSWLNNQPTAALPMSTLETLRVDLHVAEQQWNQGKALHSEVAELEQRANNYQAQLAALWTDGGEAASPLDTATLNAGWIAQAKHHALQLAASAKSVEVAEGSCAAERRAVRDAEDALVATGWTVDTDQAALDRAVAEAERRLDTLVDEADRLDAVRDALTQWQREIRQAKAQHAMGAVGREGISTRPHGHAGQGAVGAWPSLVVAAFVFALAGLQAAQHAVFDSIVTAVVGAGVALFLWIRRPLHRQHPAQGATQDGEMQRVTVMLRQHQDAVLQAVQALQVTGDWFVGLEAALAEDLSDVSHGSNASTTSRAGGTHEWSEKLQSAKDALRASQRQERVERERSQGRRAGFEGWQRASAELRRAEAALADERRRQETGVQVWHTALGQAGLPAADVTPTMLLAEVPAVLEIRAARAQAREKRERAAELADQVRDFLARAESIFHRHGAEEAPPCDDGARLTALRHRLTVAMESVNQRIQMEQALRDAQMRAHLIAGGADAYEGLAAQLAAQSPDMLAAEEERWVTEVEHWQAELDACRERQWKLEQTLDEWQDGRDTANLDWRISQLKAERDAFAFDYAAQTIAYQLVRQTRRQVEQTRQPETVRVAGDVFARVTAGKYGGLRLMSDEAESAARLYATATDSVQWPVASLSRGTREQVYLALRLAVIADYRGRGANLPVVLDDPLVNFDASRLAAVFDILNEEAAGRQMLYMTCHPSVVDLAARCGVPVVSLTATPETPVPHGR